MKSSLQCPYCHAKTSSHTLTSIQNGLQTDQREITIRTAAFPWAGGGGCSGEELLRASLGLTPAVQEQRWEYGAAEAGDPEPGQASGVTFPSGGWRGPKVLWTSLFSPVLPCPPGMSGMPTGPKCLEPLGGGVIRLVGSCQL